MAPILHWYCEKTRSIADGGAYRYGTPMWLQSLENDGVPLRFTIYRRPPRLIGRAFARIGILRPKQVTSFGAIQVPGTTVHYSDQPWALPAPRDTLKRDTYFYADDFGNRSFEVTSAASIDVSRTKRVGSTFHIEADIVGGGADYLDEDQLTFVLNPVRDPRVHVSVLSSSSEDGGGITDYLTPLVAEMIEDGMLQLDRRNNIEGLDPESIAAVLEQQLLPDGAAGEGLTLQPLWEDEFDLDPERGPAMLSLAVLPRRPPGNWLESTILALNVQDAETGESLARSDPVVVFRRPFNGIWASS